MRMTGGQMLCESLLREGVSVVFGLPGGAILPLYQTLPQFPQLRHILVRHEQGAAFAADGYARATGRPGVCWATSGPGATNLVTGLACSMMDSVPVVAITGQVARSAIGTDAFQETDITGITVPITKHNYLVTRAADVPQVIREAFCLAGTGRPGPVLVDIPKDVLTEEADFNYPEVVHLPGYRPILEAPIEQVRKAAGLIAAAKRPLILAGHGVIISRAFQELRELAERAQTPVVSTLLGLSSFPEDHILYVGMPGMHGAAYASMAINEADLLIAIGMRFDDRVTGKLSAFAPNASVIHIEIDPAEVDKNIKAHVALVGDAKHVLRQLLPLIQPKTNPEWLRRVEELKQAHALGSPRPDRLQQRYVLERLSEITDGRAIIVTGVGQHQMWAAQYYQFKEPNLFMSSGGLGAMGYEVPAAMGAQLGRPDKVVWSIAGDGGFQMTMYELATMVENNIPVKFALMDNSYLGMVRQWQDLFYKKTYVATHYTRNPDFVKLAEAFGLWAVRVKEVDHVDDAIHQAMLHQGPALIDFWVDQEENVFPMIPPGQTVAELMEEPEERVHWKK
ncbi:MAG: biosynthetic-type acetolactate synthase large subunit [Chloroflexi bacterium]|nr:biosynthetic-type acetolactate synthase large subunit [Chloroflexota bacterium]